MVEQIRVGPFQTVGAHTSNTSLSTVQTVTIPEGATGMLMQALTQNIRFKMDGANPTATIGFQIRAGDPPVLVPGIPGKSLKFIEETASARLEYQFITIRGGTP